MEKEILVRKLRNEEANADNEVLKSDNEGTEDNFKPTNEKGKYSIEYVDEDPWVRQYFEEELAKRGLESRMPDEVYTNPDFTFKTASTASK